MPWNLDCGIAAYTRSSVNHQVRFDGSTVERTLNRFRLRNPRFPANHGHWFWQQWRGWGLLCW